MITPQAREKMGWKKNKVFTAYEKNCVMCGTIFKTVPTSSKQFTCSVACMSKRREKERVRIKCAICATEIITLRSRNRKYCSSSCKITGLAAMKIERFKTSRLFGRWKDSKAMKKYLLEKYGCCQRCGWKEEVNVLEAHHKDRNRRNNTEENVDLICPNCHSIDHYKSHDGQFRNNLGVYATH